MSECGYVHMIEVTLKARVHLLAASPLIRALGTQLGSSGREANTFSHRAIFITPPHNFNYFRVESWWLIMMHAYSTSGKLRQKPHYNFKGCLSKEISSRLARTIWNDLIPLLTCPPPKKIEHIQYCIQVVIFVNLWTLESQFQFFFFILFGFGFGF